MPRFFFDFFDGQEWQDDELGIELPSSEQAYVEAYKGARGMWAELIRDRCDPMRCAFAIRDEHGQTLFRVAFSEFVSSFGGSEAPAPSAAIARMLEDSHARASLARSDFNASITDMRRLLGESRRLLSRLDALAGRR